MRKEAICGWEIHSPVALFVALWVHKVESPEGKLLQSCGMSKYKKKGVCMSNCPTHYLFKICFAFSSPPSSLSLRRHTVQDSWWKAWVLWDYWGGIVKGQGSRQSGKWFFSVSGLTPTGLKNLNKVPRFGVFADENRTPYRGSEYPNIERGSNTQKLFMFYLFKALFVLNHCSVHVCTMHTV